MAPLTLTQPQADIVNALETPINDAFSYGVDLPTGTDIPAIDGYVDLAPDDKTKATNGIKQTLAPLLSALSTVPPSYQVITSFDSGYSAYGVAFFGHGEVRISKDILGYVHVNGLVKAPTVGDTQGVTILTLPVGYRPGNDNTLIFPSVTNNSFCCLYLYTDGRLTADSPITNGAWISINLSFYPEG